MLAAAPALAFEGEVDAKSIGNAAAGVVEFQIYVSKNGDVRMDTSTKGPNGKTHRGSYIKPAKGKYDYALDHVRKQATKIPKDTLTKMTKGEPGQTKGKKANVEVKKLGTDKVAGQTTRHVQVIDKDDGSITDLWLSDRYSAKLWQTVFSFGGDKGESPTTGWMPIVEREYGFKPGFIMKMVSKGKDGARGGLEVTRIQEKQVAANKFAPPAGYEVVEMPDMSGGLTNMKMPTTREEAEKMRDEWMKKMQEQQR
jgi:hypothetical protein